MIFLASSLQSDAAGNIAKKLRAEWPNIAKEAELPKQVHRALHEHLDRIPLLRG
jgi:hypothetical protein